MSLAAGTRLGPYQITAQIGEGGMGEVYRATDTNLKRAVALKVLPASVATDPDRLARFQREAHVLAALNHPHIAQIHGLEDGHGQTALVMELVEGPTLADRISQGPIPLDEALPIAKQIGEALEAAHEHGIVHRDLKPANIKVREDGTVKVLDFGLAKAIDPAAVSRDIANSPTLTSPSMTRHGAILGTAAYMAPEQARGKAVDKRADIWAFGVVLFEMLTGRRLFASDDVTDTIASIVKTQPDFSQVPVSVRRLLSRCLEKDPSRRLRDIGDAWDLLEHPASHASTDSRVLVRRWWPLWIAGAVLTSAAVALVFWLVTHRGDAPRIVLTRFVDALAEGQAMPRGISLGTVVALSPDGRALVYRVQENGEFRLYRRFLDQVNPEPIGDPGAAEPFFSPDGAWVGFHVGRTLKRVHVRGGPAQTIVELPGVAVRGASWNPDGTIILGGLQGLWRVNEKGGEVATLATAADPTAAFPTRLSHPQLLPGGRVVLLTESRAGSETLLILDLKTGTSKRLLEGFAGRYLPTGHLVFVRGDVLWATAFDLDRLDVQGSPVPIVEGIRSDGPAPGPAAQMAFATTGALAYVPGTVSQQRSLVWVDRQGREQPLGAEPRAYANPRVSPDGTRIAVTMRDAGRDVWIWDVGRHTLKQLTSDPAPNYLAAWFPDSKRLAFSAEIGDVSQIHLQAADGSGIARALTQGPRHAFPNAISRDGSSLVLMDVLRQPFESDIGVLQLENHARPILRKTPEIERNAAISPDGRWLAYESDRAGRVEIYVRPFPNIEDAEYIITTDGGTAPVWAHSGRELFYWKQSGAMASIMAVPITPGQAFESKAAHPIARGWYARPIFDRQYDVAPDGRFVVMKPVGRPPRDEIVIVLNWFEELKRLVPTR
jgi:eukaryotic-like serine/threonine-protein kinase